MMSNLFSIFDPNTNMEKIDMNWWMGMYFNLMCLPISFWFFQSKMFYIFNNINLVLLNEFKNILSNKFNISNILLFNSLFMYILFNNLMGLFPYIFTSSSHLIFSVSISLPFWFGLMMFGWLKNANFMFSHMIPRGTPNLLMPFMVLIESISNIIRPGTLSIRLTANIIAGHLLLTLLSQSANTPLFILSILIILIQIILLILEFSVSIIQSYVFTILSLLYSKETN